MVHHMVRRNQCPRCHAFDCEDATKVTPLSQRHCSCLVNPPNRHANGRFLRDSKQRFIGDKDANITSIKTMRVRRLRSPRPIRALCAPSSGLSPARGSRPGSVLGSRSSLGQPLLLTQAEIQARYAEAEEAQYKLTHRTWPSTVSQSSEETRSATAAELASQSVHDSDDHRAQSRVRIMAGRIFHLNERRSRFVGKFLD
jgi:hypothetical protein